MPRLDFSESAKEAARNLLKDSQFDQSELEQRILSAEEFVINDLVNPKSYGVEDAILANTQIRLLDQINMETARLNCSEVGINMYLLFVAIGAQDRVRMLRFNDNHESDHLALLHYTDGFDKDPLMIDPLFGRVGRVKFTSKGLLYTPPNSIDLNDPPDKKQEPKQLLQYERVCILSHADVINHIEVMNSPLGFFKYFERGQKIKSEHIGVDVKPPNELGLRGLELFGTIAEYSVRTIDDTLQIQVTLKAEKALDLFTFQRTYNMEEGELSYSDDRLLHLGHHWSPEQIVFSQSKGMHPESWGDNKAITIAYTTFARQYLKTMLRDPEEARQIQFQELQDDIVFYHNIVRKFVREKTKRDPDGTLVIDYDRIPTDKDKRDIADAHIHELKPKTAKDFVANLFHYDELKCLSEQRKSLLGMPIEEQRDILSKEYYKLKEYGLMDDNEFISNYVRRVNKATRDHPLSASAIQLVIKRMAAQRPYSKFRPEERPEVFLKARLDYKEERYRPLIDIFLQSEVLEKLVTRYQGLMELRKHVGLAA